MNLNKEIKMETAQIINTGNFYADAEYNNWLKDIQNRYINHKYGAFIKVNAEKLEFNWSLGRDLVIKKAEEKWGSKVVEQLSLDLKDAFPADKGFGVANLWFMKKWYLFFSSEKAQQKLYQLGRELQNSNCHYIKASCRKNEETISTDFPNVLSLVPWRHQVEIITKCANLDEAVFYLGMCIKEGWSRTNLINSIKATLSPPQSTCQPPTNSKSGLNSLLD